LQTCITLFSANNITEQATDCESALGEDMALDANMDLGADIIIASVLFSLQ